MITIRPYKDSDKEQLELICIETADKNIRDTAKKREMLLLEYNRYYTRACKDTIFVADCGGKAVGYILCDTNYNNFLKNFKKNEYKQLKKIDFLNAVNFYLSLKGEKIYSKNYSAHMHIDILPEFQRQGIGHKLVDALKCKLEGMNVNGVFLSVSMNNKIGVPFYYKYGFEPVYLCKHFGIFALKL